MLIQVILLGLFFRCEGQQQWIFPDQFETMTSSISPFSQILDIGQTRQTFTRDSTNFASPITAAVAAAAPRTPALSLSLQQPWEVHATDIISRGIMKFALDMDNAIFRSRGRSVSTDRDASNVIFSPLSLAGAMALVLLGSSGKTFDEVSRILGLEAGVDISRHSEIVHQMFGLLLSAVNVPGSQGSQTAFASGIFVQDGYPIRPEFKSISQKVYKSEVINMDFMNRGREVQQLVNAWVKERTRGKITSILDDLPSPATKVIIASALYFNGEWDQYFFNDATARRPFTIRPGETVEVDMMFNGGEFPYFEDKILQAKIVGLPYKGRDITMYVLLPNAKGVDALKDIENRLNADVLDNLISNMKNETCIIGIPRMKLSSSLTLNEALRSLGLTSLFDPNSADLSLLSSGLNVPQALASQSRIPSSDSFIFPRLGDNDQDKTEKPLSSWRPNTKNYFRYEDMAGGYRIEQWATGFRINRIRRELRERRRRDHVSGAADENFEETMTSEKKKVEEKDLDAKKRASSMKQDRNAYATSKTSREDESRVKVIELGESKYRFAKRQVRPKRQIRPINGDFLDFVNSQNFPSFGLDELRNNVKTPNPGLYADDVLHKVEIEVSEKGTEAAAATAVLLTKDGSKKRLRADHPFIFFIRHEPTKLLLFWGSVNVPTPNYPSG